MPKRDPNNANMIVELRIGLSGQGRASGGSPAPGDEGPPTEDPGGCGSVREEQEGWRGVSPVCVLGK